MDEFPQTVASVNSINLVLTDSLPSTSLHPPLLQPRQPRAETEMASDIDLVSLLFGPLKFGSQNTSSVSGSLNTADQNGGSHENGRKHKRKASRSKKAIPPRIAFHTRSPDDILDDGYRWRKYGQKAVKNSIHPRSYYRCTHHTCNVKKQIQRLSKDSSIVETTYEGIHNHPCEKLMESLSPLLRQLQFLSGI